MKDISTYTKGFGPKQQGTLTFYGLWSIVKTLLGLKGTVNKAVWESLV